MTRKRLTQRKGLLSTTGVLLIASVIGLTLHEWRDSVTMEEPATASGPKLVFEGARGRGFTPTGDIQYRFMALAMSRYPDTPTRTLMAMPWMELHDNNRLWTANARRGRIDNDGQRHIMLNGRVRARRWSGKPLELKTEQLLYQPASGQVSAPGAVEIRHQGGRTSAGALRAWVPDGRLKLRQGVETHYVPTS